MIVGQEVLPRLMSEGLPPVALFVGPKSVGKWAVAEFLRRQNKILDSDVLRIHKLSAGLARAVVPFASTAPVGDLRLAIIELDDATPSAVHILLKTLEESSRAHHFILIAQHLPLPTLVSRSQVHQFRLLTEAEVTDILVERRGFKLANAQSLAALAGGQVSMALENAVNEGERALVVEALTAFRDHNPAVLDAVAPKWRDEHTALLTKWCTEALTGRWSLFNAEQMQLPGRLPLRILMALKANVRPKLVVRSQLMTLLRGIS